MKSDQPSELPPEVDRRIEEEMGKFVDHLSWKRKMEPPVPWAAAFRLPDGAVTADEGGGGGSVSFLFVPRDGKNYHVLNCRFRGAVFEDDSSIRDAKDAQLRRWKASDWWPTEWR